MDVRIPQRKVFALILVAILAALTALPVAAATDSALANNGLVAGTAYVDFNRNGIWDGNEPVASGRTVYLQLVGPDVTGQAVIAVEAEDDGAFVFDNLAAGEYLLLCDGCTGMSITVGEVNGAVMVDLPVAPRQVFLPLAMR